MSAPTSVQLYPGITFHGISDSRFKTNKISVHLIVPLSCETAAANALIPSLLRKGYDQMNDFTKFHQYLNELYGAEVLFGVEKSGDLQIMSLSIIGIDDRYTLENEQLTVELSQMLFDLLLRPALKNGTFLKQEVDLEKISLVDAIEAQINDKRSYALHTAMRLMCADEPFGIFELGTVEQVKALTTEQVTQQYQTLLQTARVEIMFVGCGNPDISLQVAKDRMGVFAHTEGARHKTQTQVHGVATATIHHTEMMELSQSKMVMGFSSGVSPTNTEIFALRMLCMIFGGTPTSKLFVHVREKLSLCYYCAATLEKSKGILRVDCGVENKNIDQAKKEILLQLTQIKQGAITENEYQDTLLSFTNTMQTIGDSLHALEGYYLGQILNDTSYTPEEEIKGMRAVELSDMIDVANKLHLDLIYTLTNQTAE